MTRKETNSIVPLPMDSADLATAGKVAKRLGFGASTAYTSSSAITGLYCLATHSGQTEGVIIKTERFGFMFVQDLSDMGMEDLAS